MSILSNFFISDPANALDYDEAAYAPEDQCVFNRITPLEAGGVWTAIRNEGDRLSNMDAFNVLNPHDESSWTFTVPAEMVTLLAAFDDSQLAVVAARCAEQTAEELGWSQDDFLPLIKDLAALSKRALEQGKAMFLWNCL